MPTESSTPPPIASRPSLLRRIAVPLVALIVLGGAGVALLACPHSGAPAAQLVPGKAYPHDVAEAQALKQQGTRWDNREIRAWYLAAVATIAPADQRLVAERKSAEERARAAFAIRHDARLTARAMMAEAADVEALRERDRAKYGNPDGPTFDQLVAASRGKGLQGDAAYDAIRESAQRTNNAVNDLLGVK